MTKEQQFEEFWKSYPRRVAKGAARKAFEKAIKKTTLEKMQEAIKVYVAMKPEKIDFKHPATWLNGECWDDEWEIKKAAPAPVKIESREEYIRKAIEQNNQAWEPSSNSRVSDLIKQAVRH